MSTFDKVTRELEDAVKSGSLPAGMHDHLTAMLNSPQIGGVSGLVQKFEAGGLGGIIGSWIGTGPNQSITPQQIEGVLGSGRLQQIASKVGLPPETLGNAIAQVLPGLIDRMTPNGVVPAKPQRPGT
ncbi:MAG: YidB family protein [Gemmatimonadales bacterium]